MSSAEAVADGQDASLSEPKSGSRKKLILIAVPALLGAIGGGLWFSGILPKMLGMGPKPAAQVEEASGTPVFVELPDLVANLNAPRRNSFVKIKARLEFSKESDADLAKAAMPRLQDLFTTYLREMRPEELRGSLGTYRLREELIARANVVLAPAHVRDILFTEMLVQ